jgi:hypothetical protein
MDDESFLGRVFDSYQNMRQIAACMREAARQRQVAVPRVLELSRRETGLGDYLPDARLERFATHEDDQPTLGTPVALPFADGAFDGCLISDVYEHIPAERRPELLAEMLRVTRGLVLVAAPRGNALVTRLDRVVFDFIWGKYGERFVPLEQHMAYGLESVESTVESLKVQGVDEVVVLPGNYVYRWIHMILIYFDLQHRNPHAALFEPLNRIYNERLSPYDYREPCYRFVIAVATDPALNVLKLRDALQAPAEPPELAAETDAMLVQTFREIDARAADRLRQCAADIADLKAENDRLAAENARHADEITGLRDTIAELRRGIVNRVARWTRRRLAVR